MRHKEHAALRKMQLLLIRDTEVSRIEMRARVYLDE
jgi:hypothetical protein